MYIYRCGNNHVEEISKPLIKRDRRHRCPTCGLWSYRDVATEYKANAKKTIHVSKTEDPVHHLLTKRSTKGVLIEHLTPDPVYVTSRQQYDDLLRKTNSREKVSKYNGVSNR
jgi:acetyl-CoA carboxylase beta subunit